MAKNLFDIKVGKFPTKAIAKKAERILADKQKKLLRLGPGLLRNSIQEVLLENPRTRSYANSLRNIPAESRAHGHPKLGSGIMMKLSGGKINTRIRITPRLFPNENSYYALMVAQYGRGPVKAKGKALAMAVKTVRNGQKAIPHRTRPGYFVIFATYAGPVAPYYDWIGESQKHAIKKFVKLVEKI